MLKSFLLTAVVLSLSACGPIPHPSGKQPTATTTKAANLPSASGALVKLDNPNFSVYYNTERNTPSFVVESLTAQNVSQKVSRIDEFSTDSRVQQYGTQAYTRSGYDRGHMAAAANQTNDSMAASNLLSNIVPQTPDSNRQSWRELEERTRDIIEKQPGTTYVISGVIGEVSQFPVQYGDPYILQPNQQGSSVRDAMYPKGLLKANIAIPAYLYKIRIHGGKVQEVSVTPNCVPESTIAKNSKNFYCYTKHLAITSYGNQLDKFLQDYSAWDNSYSPAFQPLVGVINTLLKE
jgi:DNA/RNA endonuclease G (NUC1)